MNKTAGKKVATLKSVKENKKNITRQYPDIGYQ
jgi:hypothetical protein